MSDQSQSAAVMAQPLALGTLVEGWIVKAVLGQSPDGFNYRVESEKDGRERVLCEFFPAGLALRLGTVVVPTLSARNEFALAMQKFVEQAQRDRQTAHPAHPILSDVIHTNGSAYVVSLWHEGQPLRVSLAVPASPTTPPWSYARDDREFMQALAASVQSVAQAVPAGPQIEWPNRAPAKPSLARPRSVTAAPIARQRPAIAQASARRTNARPAAGPQDHGLRMPLGLAAAAVMALIAGVWMTMQVMPDHLPLAARRADKPAVAPAAMPSVVVAFRPSSPTVANEAVAQPTPPSLNLATAQLDALPAPAAGRAMRQSQLKATASVSSARAEMVAQAAVPADRSCSDWLVRQSLGMPHPGGTEAQTLGGCR